MNLHVITPAEIILTTETVTFVEVNAFEGRLGILPDHAALLAETLPGPLFYEDETGAHSLELPAGILQVHDNRLTIFTSAGPQEAIPNEEDEEDEVEEQEYQRLTQALFALLEATAEGDEYVSE